MINLHFLKKEFIIVNKSIDNVTDKDVEKLDITEYRLIENDSNFLFHEEGK